MVILVYQFKIERLLRALVFGCSNCTCVLNCFLQMRNILLQCHCSARLDSFVVVIAFFHIKYGTLALPSPFICPHLSDHSYGELGCIMCNMTCSRTSHNITVSERHDPNFLLHFFYFQNQTNEGLCTKHNVFKKVALQIHSFLTMLPETLYISSLGTAFITQQNGTQARYNKTFFQNIGLRTVLAESTSMFPKQHYPFFLKKVNWPKCVFVILRDCYIISIQGKFISGKVAIT